MDVRNMRRNKGRGNPGRVGAQLPDVTTIDEQVLASSSVHSPLADNDSHWHLDQGNSQELGVPFFEFRELMYAADADSEEDFVVNLMTGGFRTIKLVGKSTTSFKDTDFVFNNQSTKIVAKTADVCRDSE